MTRAARLDRRRVAGLAWAPRAILLVACFGPAIAFGWMRHADRARVWQTPRWDTTRLTLIRGAMFSSEAERWVVAVNPKCPHCRAELARLVATPRGGRPARIDALIVDTPERPKASEIQDAPVAAVWWDARNAWRERWGHRVYGELFVFDTHGRYLRTAPPPEP
jgi:hypothetical protein